MKFSYIHSIFIIIFSNMQLATSSTDWHWCVVGAGPAGITAIGVLLDSGVRPEKILWLDKEFNVGRLGQYYQNVPGNNNAEEFITFINACNAFQSVKCSALDDLRKMNMKDFCSLSVIIEPLKCITDHFRAQIRSVKSELTSLYSYDAGWCIGTDKGLFTSKYVILATGSHPKELPYANEKVIPLDLALDFTTLKSIIKPNDVVAVVGGSHSAILILKYLSEINVKHVYNYFKYPITYAKQNRVLFELEGLKGSTAKWAKEVLEVNPPINLTRVQFSQDNCLGQQLKNCTKVIYAIGYEQNSLPQINGNMTVDCEKNAGAIAPGLFGMGIAFPEKKVEDGKSWNAIGLNNFMEYAQKTIPYLCNSKSETSRFQSEHLRYNPIKALENLFSIYIL